MNYIIREMKECDRDAVLNMMRVFYASEAVMTNGSEEIFETDFTTCISDSPYLDGYVFLDKNTVIGYAMTAKSFSTEFGKPCIWIEDLFVIEPYRGKSIGSTFLKYLNEKYPTHVIRLEAEAENETAVHTYRKNGFEVLPYLEMIRK